MLKIHECKAMPKDEWGLMTHHDGICAKCGEDLEKEQLRAENSRLKAELENAKLDVKYVNRCADKWARLASWRTEARRRLETERDELKTSLAKAKAAMEGLITFCHLEADFRNGNTHEGRDEGHVRAMELIEYYEKVLAEISETPPRAASQTPAPEGEKSE